MGTTLEGEPDSLFAGVLDYLDGLRPGDSRRIVTEAEAGGAYLGQAIRFPTPAQVSLLMVDERSRDLGTDQTVPVVAAPRGAHETRARTPGIVARSLCGQSRARVSEACPFAMGRGVYRAPAA